MPIDFFKYQGTGNDFVLLDDKAGVCQVEALPDLARRLCNRRFGIGSDGLIVLQPGEGTSDYRMLFFNPDGSVSLCGNGSRCALWHFTQFWSPGVASVTFEASDGVHRAKLSNGMPGIEIFSPREMWRQPDGWFLHVGAPHFVLFVEDVSAVDVVSRGRSLRYDERFTNSGGTNVNFVEISRSGLRVRTYEKGVEDETLSCGTGVTASALAAALEHTDRSSTRVETRGGELRVEFNRSATAFSDIWLFGPVELTFTGTFHDAELPVGEHAVSGS